MKLSAMDRKHFLQGIIFIIIVLSIINYKLINENPAIKISEQNVKFNDSKEINYETEGHIVRAERVYVQSVIL